ncbi:MAG: ribonucleotide reductase N-terminal alpha domain-containing protein, partial [Erysipelotrichaceae bacterium]|nr:ribonucleotide reductase N-terminal alpha domain-containing protein [Erysipelotrichaceae bacterium]
MVKSQNVTYFELNNELNRPVDGKIPLHKDKEAVRAFFLEHVNPDTVFFYTLDEKLDYLMDNDFIEREFIEKYDRNFVKYLLQKTYEKKFRFKSFMAAFKFYKQYALKTNDNQRYLERFEDRIVFNALYLANGDERLAEDLAEELITQRYQPATPTFLNAGRKRRGEFVSCFLIQATDDMNSIGRTINSALQLSRIGGGVGVTLSNIRAAGDPIKKIENASSGVVPVMKLLEDSFSYSNQLGQRNGAGAVYLNVFHPDIVSFLSTKKENADEKIRVKTLSLGLIVPDKFYELVKNDDMMYLFSPYDVQRVYHVPFSYVDITKEYDKMVNNPEIKKSKIRARDLENEISKL